MAENDTGRPLTRRGRETRQRIVAAAAELMFENAVAETTLEDISAAAGVSGSQVYHDFADKQALVRVVIDYQTDAVLDTQGTHLAGASSRDRSAPAPTSPHPAVAPPVPDSARSGRLRNPWVLLSGYWGGNVRR